MRDLKGGEDIKVDTAMNILFGGENEEGGEAANTASRTSSWLGGALSTIKLNASKFAENVVAESIKAKDELLEEHKKYVAGEARSSSAQDGAENLPWEHLTEARESARTKILTLSKHYDTFLTPPPEDVGFSFEMDSINTARAMRLLEEDECLGKARYHLVRPRPTKDKVLEKDFWRNYFYRVSVILDVARVTEEGHGGCGDCGAFDVVQRRPRQVGSENSKRPSSGGTVIDAHEEETEGDAIVAKFLAKTEDGMPSKSNESWEMVSNPDLMIDVDIDVNDEELDNSDINSALEMDFASEGFIEDADRSMAMESLKKELGLTDNDSGDCDS